MAKKKKYTDYVQCTYKKQKYYIRAWIEYDLIEANTKKTFKFTAGFQTKTRACSMGEITLNVKANRTANEGKGNITRKKEFKGTSATTSIKFIDETTWVWPPEDEGIVITLTGTFGSTRFSGKKVTLTLKMVGDKIDFTADRIGETATGTLTFTVKAGALATVTEPTVKVAYLNSARQSAETWTTLTGLTWYKDGTAITFPYAITSIPFTMTASVTPDVMHTHRYQCICDVGNIHFNGWDSLDYVTEPSWNVVYQTNIQQPNTDHDGKPIINIYANDNRAEGYTYSLLPDECIGEIEEVGDGYWQIPLTLTDQYVANWTIPNTTADIKLEWGTYNSTSTTSEKSRAIYETNRNANFSTGLANNVFIGGCSFNEYSSRIWYSAVNNPLYFPDLNYIEVGSTDTKVVGLTKVGDYLGVIKQSNTTDTSVFLVYPTSFDDDTTFAAKPCAGGVGALGEFCFNVLGDETLFLSPRGVMAIEPNEDEQSRIRDRSYFINGRMLEEPNLDKAYSFVHDGFYLLAVNNHIYVLDGNQRNSWGNQKTNLVYECYFLDDVPAKTMFSYDDELWFSDDKGNICRFKDKNEPNAYLDGDVPVEARWTTIADDDGSLHYYKTLTKKGCVVSLLPEDGTTATVTIVRDEGGYKNEFLMKTYDPLDPEKKLPTSLYTRKKVKKYKRLQFVIEDNTAHPFGVDKIIKSYTLGSYAKK